MAMTDFSVGMGFHFPNDFVNHVLSLGGLNITTQGRCGGMAYAALDYYFNSLPIPTHEPQDFPTGTVPPDGSLLADYIYRRLLKSFAVPTALKFISWTEKADHDTRLYTGVTNMTRKEEFPQLRRMLDRGTPAVLGLVVSTSLGDLGDNHQVVAYGYDYDDATRVATIHIYDNNYPDVPATLTMTPANPHILHSANKSYRGFFVQDYAPVRPPYLDLRISSGLSVGSSWPVLHDRFDAQFTIRNYGAYTAHLASLYIAARSPRDEDVSLGADWDATPLQPGEERTLGRGNDHFGTVSGEYHLWAGYVSRQQLWALAPTGEPGTINDLRIQVHPPGIGGYNLVSTVDRAFAFDYNGSGKLDHLVLYRPGTGTIWILRNNGGQFTPVYAEGDPGNGIGGFNLVSTDDRAFAFDYNGSGKLDHLVLYRPGTGTIWILRNNGGQFTPVYAEGDPGDGIGGFNLVSTDDRAFAFDYNSSGKLDHLVLYRPGTGTIWILRNNGGRFTPVYAEGDPGDGIGGFNLVAQNDRVFAFDYNGSGKLDHLVLYRPGTGTIWILRNNGGQFTPVYAEGDPGDGIGGYDLASPDDEVFAFDYNGSGKLDHLVLYRPGTGTIWILRNNGGQFTAIYQSS